MEVCSATRNRLGARLRRQRYAKYAKSHPANYAGANTGEGRSIRCPSRARSAWTRRNAGARKSIRILDSPSRLRRGRASHPGQRVHRRPGEHVFPPPVAECRVHASSSAVLGDPIGPTGTGAFPRFRSPTARNGNGTHSQKPPRTPQKAHRERVRVRVFVVVRSGCRPLRRLARFAERTSLIEPGSEFPLVRFGPRQKQRTAQKPPSGSFGPAGQAASAANRQFCHAWSEFKC